MAERKKLLIVIRHSPYGSGLAAAAVNTVLACAAFEQTVDILFIGDGVLQLSPQQNGQQAGVKTISRQLASLPLYDLEQVYADAGAAGDYNIDLQNAPVKAIGLERQAIRSLMQQADHLMSF